MKTSKAFLIILLAVALSVQSMAQPLRTLAGNCNLNIGAAISDDALRNDPTYSTVLKQEFNMVVNENAMKMFVLKPSENGPYNFDGADRLVALAQANGMKMRGHTILWHDGLPDWVKNKAWTKTSLLNYLKGYITTVVGRYRGKITEWDVANEFVQNGNNNALRTTESVWMRVIGEEVLDSAFKWVHQVDPTAKLYYNDYGAENMGGKSNAVYDLARRLKQRGAPIHGVGLQSHFGYDIATTSGNTFLSQMDQNIKRLGALGLQVSMTELDLSIPVPFDANKYQQQGTSYGNLMKLALDNSSIVKSFVIWGFTDKFSWIPNFTNNTKGAALIFYNDYTKKPAYNSIANVLRTNCPSVTCTASITATTSTTFCQGGSVVLTASNGSSYKWFRGTTQVAATPTYTATIAGSYTVEVTYASGCRAVSPATIVNVTVPTTWYADADGDGKGDPAITLVSCIQPTGYVADRTDLCPADRTKINPGACGCGIAEGTCTNQAPVVSFAAPLSTSTFTAPATVVVKVNATDADGSIASVDLFVNDVFVRQEKVAPYEWNVSVVDAALVNLAAGNYTLKVVATDNLGKTTAVTQTTLVNPVVVNTDKILGADCASANASLVYELNPSYRVNATGYSWWFSGSQATATPMVGSPYKATFVLTNYYSGGSVCVGVNYSTAPYYASYCKVVGVCGAKLGSVDVLAETMDASIAVMFPNPTSGDVIFVDSKAPVQKLEIKDRMGVVIKELDGSVVQGGFSVAGIPAGTYFVKMVLENEIVNQKLVIVR